MSKTEDETNYFIVEVKIKRKWKLKTVFGFKKRCFWLDK